MTVGFAVVPVHDTSAAAPRSKTTSRRRKRPTLIGALATQEDDHPFGAASRYLRLRDAMHILPIFPRSGFDQSVTTPVLLGVLVSWALTETFGWVFAGLVVPGYLAAVFLLEPAAGAIDLLEAVLTYFAARAIGEHLPRLGVTSRVFGRERFFLVVLVSILVRLAVEGWILPRAVPHATWAYSIGLVVVPLAANACWKTGLTRGFIQNGVPTLVVFLLLRYILVPYTNLSLAGFELATENLAAGFLGSPKAYILLVTGAMLAAAANVRYGWDFNGILVPALLGLAVFEPIKFAATFAEAMVLVIVVAIVVKVTPLRRVNIEGPRKTVLFFTIDYALRFAWAAGMGKSLPGGDIVQFMGFGFLVPTLLAVKISQKSSAPLVLLPTMKVSILGFVVGSLIGFAGHLFDRAAIASTPATQARVMPRPPPSPAGAALWVSQLAIDGIAEPDSNVTGDLSRARQVLDAVAKGDTARARQANVDVATLDDGLVVVRERFDALVARHGTPAYVFRAPLPERPVVALVPAPLAGPASAAFAGQLLSTHDVDAVVVAGIEEPKKGLVELETTAHAAARWLSGGGTLVTVREKGDARLVKGASTAPASIPERITAASKRYPNTAIKTLRGDLVLVIDPIAVGNGLSPPRTTVLLDNAIHIAAALDNIKPAASPGDLEHLINLRRLVLEPLLAPAEARGARSAEPAESWGAGAASEASVALAPFAAATLGYRLTTPTHWAPGGEAVALLPTQRGLPIAIFARTTGVRDRLVEAPVGSHHDVRDLTIRLGVALNADAIVLGEVFDGAMRGGAVRAAHGAATDAYTPAVFVVREDKTGNASKIAAWMDDGKALATTRRALDSLGIVAADALPDLAMRDLATHILLRPTAIVAVSASKATLESASLDSTRHAHEHLPEIAVTDNSLHDAAVALSLALDAARPAARDNLDEVVRRAGADGSVSAARRLTTDLAKTNARAAIVRAKEGSFLVAVAKSDRRSMVIVSALTDAGDFHTERRASLAACTDAPVIHGVCETIP
jgi:hypothetical protein